MTGNREPMASVDAAWLRMESDNNPMMIAGVLILDRPIDIERLRDVLKARFLCFKRFRQRVIDEGDRAWWEVDPTFHIDHHLHRIGLPGGAGEAELQELIGDLISTPLNFRRPLWQMHLVEPFGEGAALVVRIHHCIADGLALVQVLLSFTDETDDQDGEDHSLLAVTELAERVFRPARGLIRRGLSLGQGLLGEGVGLIRHPSHLLDLARQGVATGMELAHLGLLPADPETFKPVLSGRKQVAWSAPLDLERVKATAHALAGTVNDVLLASVAGALREFLLAHEVQISSDIHVALPFNLRSREQPISELGNQFGLVVVPLPVGVDDPKARFGAVQKAMRELKSSAQPRATFGLLAVLGYGPAVLEKTTLEFLSKKTSLVVTNVPGPSTARFLAGARIRQPMVWVPQSGAVGLGLSILSYDGTVQFGIVADKSVPSDIQEVIRHFPAQFEVLAQNIKPSSKRTHRRRGKSGKKASED
ncbi:wax ester/triacylglycerol synthase family O-acyltransferase [Marinobacter lacisalsi]|uniref:diacylglycerol O-acyltransferase n=1 Tax=Marinobacter lacisalsi TaxID=475979 RepID=A0ABV8QDV4_9GAMM